MTRATLAKQIAILEGGKSQVCKNYFPEITTYVCLFTNLPPHTGVKR